jgi:hypothetical protein
MIEVLQFISICVDFDFLIICVVQIIIGHFCREYDSEIYTELEFFCLKDKMELHRETNILLPSKLKIIGHYSYIGQCRNKNLIQLISIYLAHTNIICSGPTL